MGQKSQGPSRGNKKKPLLFVSLGILLVAVVIVVFFLFGKKEEQEEDQRETVVTKQNVEKIKQQLSEPVEDGYYKVTMNTEWTFDDGKAASSDAYVANSEDNTRTVYFDVNLADTNELVYSSPYIPLGNELKGFKLDKDLSAGDYEAVVTYHLVDDDKKEVTTLAVTANLHILN